MALKFRSRTGASEVVLCTSGAAFCFSNWVDSRYHEP
jgi:hypothetical protein